MVAESTKFITLYFFGSVNGTLFMPGSATIPNHISRQTNSRWVHHVRLHLGCCPTGTWLHHFSAVFQAEASQGCRRGGRKTWSHISCGQLPLVPLAFCYSACSIFETLVIRALGVQKGVELWAWNHLGECVHSWCYLCDINHNMYINIYMYICKYIYIYVCIYI